jgi:hypothetical protein
MRSKHMKYLSWVERPGPVEACPIIHEKLSWLFKIISFIFATQPPKLSAKK